MPSETPPLVSRVRWKLANLLWPERLRPNKLLTRWRLRASEAEAVGRWRVARSDRPRPEARSQNGEDALLWDLVGDRQEGFFIEAGAYSGAEVIAEVLLDDVRLVANRDGHHDLHARFAWNGVSFHASTRPASTAARRSSSSFRRLRVSASSASRRAARSVANRASSATPTRSKPGGRPRRSCATHREAACRQ